MGIYSKRPKISDFKDLEDDLREELLFHLSLDLLTVDGLEKRYCQNLDAQRPEYAPPVLFTILHIDNDGKCFCEEKKTSERFTVQIDILDTETLINIGLQLEQKEVDIHPAKKMWDSISSDQRYFILKLYLSFIGQEEMIYDQDEKYHDDFWELVFRTAIHEQKFLDWIIRPNV